MPPKPRPKKTPTSKSTRPRVAGRTPTTPTTPDPTPSGHDLVSSGHDLAPSGHESAPSGHDDAPTETVDTMTAAAATEPDAAADTDSTVTTESASQPTEPTESTDDADTSIIATDDARPRGKQRPVSRVSTIRPSATAAATTAAATGATSSTTGRRGGKARNAPSWTVPIALLVTAGIFGVFALIAWLHPGANIGDNKAFIDAPATSELVGQAEDKVCVMFAVDATKLDDWAARTRAVLTGDALKEFNDYLPANKDILVQTKSVSDCRPDTVGVSFLSGSGDGATARVVAGLIISETQMGQATNSSAPRAQFDFVKHGDNWVIAKIAPF